MKQLFTLICSLFSLAVFSQVNVIRISQVYTGGGNTSATYNQDFVELFNSGAAAVDIGGWSIQYASATGPGGNGNWAVAAFPAGTTIDAGKYFLVGLSTGANGTALPATDFVNTTIDLALSAGKVALVHNATALNGSEACADAAIEDRIGYGASASCAEGTAAATTGITTAQALLRFTEGCTDLYSNSTDFALGPVSPRNTSSPPHACYGTSIQVAMPGNGQIGTVSGTASDPVSFTVSASGLSYPGAISITSSSPYFELSLNSSSGFGSSVSIPFNAFSLPATTVYVRIAANAPLGNLATIISASTDGTSFTLNLTGNVYPAIPTNQASGILVSGITTNSFTVNWIKGDGVAGIVVVRATATAAVLPVAGQAYTANSNIAAAATTGAGNFVVYNGGGAGPVTITGLSAGTSYTVSVYESSGVTGSVSYLTTAASGNPVTAITPGTSPNLTKINFTAVYTPLYMGAGTGNYIPTMFFARVSNLVPNKTYYYYTQAAVEADLGTASTGAGNPILISNYTSFVDYKYTSSPTLTNANGFGQFTTDASGSFAGSFGFVGNGDSRFTPGNIVFPTIALTPEFSGVVQRFALDQSITVLAFANSAGASNGTFIQGTSSAVAGNLVALWDNVTATGRPLSMTLVENRAFTSFEGVTPWHTGFISGYDETNGSWNAIIPNNNVNGVRLIQQLNFESGGIMGCNPDANGTWPTGSVATASPTGGTAPLKISATDAPLNTGSCFGLPNLTRSNFSAVNLSVPLYMGTGNAQRTPTMFFATVTNLSPNTTYRYFTQGAIASDIGTTSTGAGNSILIDYTLPQISYTYSSGPSLNLPGGYGRFTTDSYGSFTGSFGFVNTGNSRFTAGNQIIPAIELTADLGSPAVYRLALNQSITALAFGNTAGVNQGTFIQGITNSISPGELVVLWDNETPPGRPLSMTLIENKAFNTGNGGSAWHAGFIPGYDSTNGAWNTIIPNDNANGVKLIEGYSITRGNVLGCASDADGTWPTGQVNTTNPSDGSTPLIISASDAPLYYNDCYNVLPIRLEYLRGHKVNSIVALNWKITCLSTSIVMEVERAANGFTFSKIESIKATQARCDQPFDFSDRQPLSGKNYYRLKMIDIDGKISYSPVVMVINTIKGVEFVGAYPTAVKNEISLSVSSAKATTVETMITDITGRLIKSAHQNIPSGGSLLKIDCTNLAVGIYHITGITKEGASKTFRFVKQ